MTYVLNFDVCTVLKKHYKNKRPGVEVAKTMLSSFVSLSYIANDYGIQERWRTDTTKPRVLFL